ncbi:MAG: YDG domain-containing protein [Clostridiales bacterium]|nr:YDG domain-containing protein [Clostridiales bacterium]
MGTDAETGNVNGWFNGTWSNASPVKMPADLVLVTAEFTVKSGAHGSAAFTVTDLTMVNGDDDMAEEAGATDTGAACSLPITDPNAITATVAAPVKGQLLATTATVAADAPYTVATEKYSFLWFEGKGTEGTPVTGNAKPNQVYTVRLTLVAKEGESFDVASLNGKTNTAGWTIVTLGAPGASTCEKLWLVMIFKKTDPAAALGGTVTIDGATGGKAKFGDTLTANTTDLNYGSEAHDESTLQYQWSYYNGTGLLGATKTYTAKEADIGKQLVVTVKNANNSGSVTSDPVTIERADYAGAAPAAPTVDGGNPLAVTDASITLTYTAEGDYEFACVAKDGNVANATWQTDKTFGNLQPNTEYDFYARVKETNTTSASAPSGKVTVKTGLATASSELTNTLLAGVTPYTGEYDGAAHNALNVTGLGTSGWTVTFSTDGNTYSDTMPQVTNVSDSKTVYVKFSNDDYENHPTGTYQVTVRPKSITSILPYAAEQTYTGSALTTTVSPRDYLNGSAYVLVADKDYTVDYTGYENINVASGGKFKLKGVGNYTGEKEWTFKINPKSISDVAIAPISAMDYANRQLCPDVTVTGDGGKTLKKDTDYTVIYGENENADEDGTVTVRATANGNYTFTEKSTTFKINKVEYTGTKTASDMVRSKVTTADKTLALPVLPEGASYGTPTFGGQALISAASVSETGGQYVLTYSTTAQAGETAGMITIPVTGARNYNDYDYVVTVTAKDKEDAGVTIDTELPLRVIYGKTYTVTASAATPGTAAGTWTWVSSDPSILEIVSGGNTDTVTVKAVKANPTGATLTAKYSSETHEDTDTRTYTVAQKPITVSGFGVNAREYDGTATVYGRDVSTGNVRVFGAVEGDDVFVQFATGTYDAKDAGSRTAALTLELTGTHRDNYVLENPTYTVQNAQITPKGVTIGGTAVQPSKTYDGTTDAVITSTSTDYTVVGAVSGDNVSVDATNAKASYESKDFGTGKTVTFSGFSLTGDDAKNYKLTAQPTANADITKRTLTVTSITVADKIYDGGTDAQITNIAYGNIVSGDQVYAKITASFADANAGENKPVTFKVEHLEGKDARNYELSSSPLPVVTATIREAQLVGAPTFGKVTKAGTKLSEVDYDLSGIKGVNGEAVLVSFGWDDLTPADTTVEANKAYGWKVTTTNPNYESLTGSTVLYPVSTSYSDQVKKQSEEFEAKKRGELPEDELDFRDVYEDDYFFDAVQWAAENGITGGVGNDRFGPSLDCSRGQTMTFLWRASGEPEPDPISTDLTDVAADSYYYEAVLWAMQEGVTTGAGAGRFAPDATVTRGQFVTFLYRLAGASSDGVHPFADVPAGSYYEKAIAWAFAEGITRGTSGTTFSPDAPCTRAQIITFLYRYFNR